MMRLAPISPIAAVRRLAPMLAAGLIILAGCVDNGTWTDASRPPVIPSRSAKIPFPPNTGGCHHLVGKQWQQVPCATQRQMKKYPPLLLVPSITATSPGLGQPPVTPIVWGSVAVAMTSDPTLATEVDSLYGANAFSIQNNTGFFTCSTCSANYPMPGANAGDLGFVQFVVQARPDPLSSGPVTGLEGELCIEQWDHTYALALGQMPGSNIGLAYLPTTTCIDLTNGIRGVLTGRTAHQLEAEVIGYYQCPPSEKVTAPKCLHLAAYLPFAGGWWHLAAQDWYGLGQNGNWNNVNGTIYGYGSGSTANFTKVEFETVLNAYSCFVSPQGASGYFAVPCASPPASGMVASGMGSAAYTLEGNNLLITTGPTFGNQGSNSWLSYRSVAP